MPINQTTALNSAAFLCVYAAPFVGGATLTVNIKNAGNEVAATELALLPQKSMTIASSIILSRGEFTEFPAVELSGPEGENLPVSSRTLRGKSISAISVAGTGYEESDILTVSGGTFESAMKLVVTDVDGSGAIIAAEVHKQGEGYTALPVNPAIVSGGSGSGAKFGLVWELDVFSITGTGYAGVPSVRVGTGAHAAQIEVVMSCVPEAKDIIDGVAAFSPGAVHERGAVVIKEGWMLAAKGADCNAAVWGFEQV